MYTNFKGDKDGLRWGIQWHLAQNEFMRWMSWAGQRTVCLLALVNGWADGGTVKYSGHLLQQLPRDE